jgi:ribosome-binding protein aMBF1 (putative translation factor)
VTAQTQNIRYEDLAAKSRVFVELMRIYLRCSDKIQQVVIDMLRLIDDPEATEEDRERAHGTIAGALLAFAEESATTQDGPKGGALRLRIPPATKTLIQDQQRAFAERLRSLRLQRGWTQQDLATRSGLGQSAVSMMENGQCRPQLGTLMKLAEALGVTKKELWPGAAPLRNGQPKRPSSPGTDQKGKHGKANATP